MEIVWQFAKSTFEKKQELFNASSFLESVEIQ
jgi:hypothetical protein